MRNSSIVAVLGALAFSGCIAVGDSPHVVAKLDPSLGASCHDGDTLQLIARNGDQIVDQASAPCQQGEVELDLTTSAAVTARLLAARGAPGLDDDVVVGESGGENPYEPGTYYINVNHGFVVLRPGLLKEGRAIDCATAGIAKLRLELDDSQEPGTLVTSTFSCDQPQMYSAPSRSSRSYTMRIVALDPVGATIGEGLGAVEIPHGNSYVEQAIDVIVR
jgi:hypothetical protein